MNTTVEKQLLNADETSALRAVAAAIIPASRAWDMPSAADETIFADIVASLERDTEVVRAAMRAMIDRNGGSAAIDPKRDADLIAAWRAAEGARIGVVVRCVLQCYYRDDRVMLSLGIEPRPPFPKGHTLEQGDWSLLEPVKARGKIWRDAN